MQRLILWSIPAFLFSVTERDSYKDRTIISLYLFTVIVLLIFAALRGRVGGWVDVSSVLLSCQTQRSALEVSLLLLQALDSAPVVCTEYQLILILCSLRLFFVSFSHLCGLGLHSFFLLLTSLVLATAVQLPSAAPFLGFTNRSELAILHPTGYKKQWTWCSLSASHPGSVAGLEELELWRAKDDFEVIRSFFLMSEDNPLWLIVLFAACAPRSVLIHTRHPDQHEDASRRLYSFVSEQHNSRTSRC